MPETPDLVEMTLSVDIVSECITVKQAVLWDGEALICWRTATKEVAWADLKFSDMNVLYKLSLRNAGNKILGVSLYVGQTVLEMYRLSVFQMKSHVPVFCCMRYLLMASL